MIREPVAPALLLLGIALARAVPLNIGQHRSRRSSSNDEPSKVPCRRAEEGSGEAGCIVCHNVNWIPGRGIGEDGFRFFTLPAADPGAAKECHCGWAANLSKHYTTVGKPHTRAQHKAWLRKLMKTKEWQERYGRRPHVVRAVESFLSSP